MNLRLWVFALVVTVSAFGQNLQVNYASNLNLGDAVFNISNSGFSNGNICANIYTFSPDEQLISCCACVVTPNALVSLSARNDLTSNTLTPAVPTSIVVKILSTGGTTCNAFMVGSDAVGGPGLLAWGTTVHPTTPGDFSVSRTPFTPATVSAGELARLSGLCGFIQSNGSGFGICRSCRLGGLGADRK